MDNYESKILSCDNQIQLNNLHIAESNKEIRQLEDDISELKELKSKVQQASASFENEARSTSTSILQIPMMISSALSTIKSTLFSNLSDVITGVDYKKAQSGIENAVLKIDNKISELQSKIESLQSGIRQYNASTNALTQEKRTYILKQNEETGKKA